MEDKAIIHVGDAQDDEFFAALREDDDDEFFLALRSDEEFEEDGGAGSGNWGHTSVTRKGSVGGSDSGKVSNGGMGSGAMYRLQKPNGDYTGLKWAYAGNEAFGNGGEEGHAKLEKVMNAPKGYGAEHNRAVGDPNRKQDKLNKELADMKGTDFELNNQSKKIVSEMGVGDTLTLEAYSAKSKPIVITKTGDGEFEYFNGSSTVKGATEKNISEWLTSYKMEGKGAEMKVNGAENTSQTNLAKEAKEVASEKATASIEEAGNALKSSAGSESISSVASAMKKLQEGQIVEYSGSKYKVIKDADGNVDLQYVSEDGSVGGKGYGEMVAGASAYSGEPIKISSLKSETAEAPKATETPKATKAEAKALKHAETDADRYSQDRKDHATWDSEHEVEKEFGDWSDEMYASGNKLERSAVYSYTGPSYSTMNGMLYDGTSGYTAETVKRNVGKINQMTKFMNRMSTPKDAWIERGMHSGDLGSFFGNSIPQKIIDKALTGHADAIKDLQSLVVGNTYTQSAFLSSGASKGHGWTHRGVTINMFVPKGSHAIFVDHFSAHKGEFEMIVNRGAQLKITKIEVKSGHVYIDCDVNTPDIGKFTPTVYPLF